MKEQRFEKVVEYNKSWEERYGREFNIFGGIFLGMGMSFYLAFLFDGASALCKHYLVMGIFGIILGVVLLSYRKRKVYWRRKNENYEN